MGTVCSSKRIGPTGYRVDVIVAQGWEAGGHVRGSFKILQLISVVVDVVSDVPVVTASCIADGRRLDAVLVLSASATWIGTRFLTSEEAQTIYKYKIYS